MRHIWWRRWSSTFRKSSNNLRTSWRRWNVIILLAQIPLNANFQLIDVDWGWHFGFTQINIFHLCRKEFTFTFHSAKIWEYEILPSEELDSSSFMSTGGKIVTLRFLTGAFPGEVTINEDFLGLTSLVSTTSIIRCFFSFSVFLGCFSSFGFRGKGTSSSKKYRISSNTSLTPLYSLYLKKTYRRTQW